MKKCPHYFRGGCELHPRMHLIKAKIEETCEGDYEKCILYMNYQKGYE